jgi:phospholipase/carboxylesterase
VSDPTDATVSLIAHLLGVLDRLESAERHLHPSAIPVLAAPLGPDHDALAAALAGFRAVAWPAPLADFRDQAVTAAQAALRACTELTEAAGSPDGLRLAYRALRNLPRAAQALYPLAGALPTVSAWFLEANRREDPVLLARLATAGPDTGIHHFGNHRGTRGGYSVYVPETYEETTASPLIMALHGGSGHGRHFLWSWLRNARSRDMILVSPTSPGATWSIMDPEVDGPHLARILEIVGRRWHIDPARLLLTGMSDGGTFTLVSGLQEDSPFTHLAPVAASFHPLLLTMAEPARVRGLPIYLLHGALDWMFPISVARTANRALTAAGANVTYREVADLSHVYPRDETPAILDWFARHGRGPSAQT